MSLTRMIKKMKKEANRFKILIVGPDNAGKTTILHNLFNKEIDHIAKTFGYQIHTQEYEYQNNQKVKLVILDVGGQSSLRKYWSNFYEKLDGIIFVFDKTDSRDKSPLLNNIVNENNNKDIPILILANKCDLTKAYFGLEGERNVSTGAKIFECSGKTGENLKTALIGL